LPILLFISIEQKKKTEIMDSQLFFGYYLTTEKDKKKTQKQQQLSLLLQ